MSKFKEFKKMLKTCWADRENVSEYWMTYGTYTIFVAPHVSDEGEDLLWIVLENADGKEIRGDSVYEEGLDDEFLYGVFKYITTGEEY